MRIGSRKFWLSLILFLAPLFVYGQTCWHGFLNCDDDDYVERNPWVYTGLTRSNTAWAFTTFYAANWHPGTWLSLQLDAQFYGQWLPGLMRAVDRAIGTDIRLPVGAPPWGFHLTNTLLHAANTVLLFWALQLMTGALWRSGLVAAFFALHPLHVESVAWITERKDVLSTLFWMAACLSYGWYAARPDWRRYALTLMAFAMGLLVKPMLVTLPFVLLLLDYWPLDRFRLTQSKTSTLESSTGTAILRRFLTLTIEKLPFFLLSAGSCFATWYAQRWGHAIGSLERYPIATRISNAIWTTGAYLGQTFWPFNVGPYHAFPTALLAQIWPQAAVGLMLLVITVLVCVRARSQGYLPVGWFWYLGTLVPVVGLVQVGSTGRADRYTYVPLVGLFIMLVWGAADLAARWSARKIMSGVAAALVLACTLLTCKEVAYWRSNPLLWRHTVEACGESSPGYTLLGYAYMEEKQYDLAIQYYQDALRIEPDNAYALLNFGVALDRQGKLEEAVEQYRKTVTKYPLWARPQYNLGGALSRLGRKQEAIAAYEGAIRCDPRWNTAHESLGQLLFANGKVSEAAGHYRAAFDDGWRNDAIYAGLGHCLIVQGKFAEAVKVLRQWASTQAGEWRPRSLLGLALYESGEREEAAKQFQTASNMNRGWPEVLNQEALVLASDPEAKNRNGKLAVVVAQQACRATKDREPRYLDTLAAAYAEAGDFRRAAEVARQAIQAAKAAQAEHLTPAIRQRLDLYEQRRPYRTTPQATSN